MDSHLFNLWCTIIGALFIGMALINSVVKRLPLTSSMLYLGIGCVLGPYGFGLLQLDALRHASLIERIAEVAVLISLFTSGLQLRVPLHDSIWKLPLRLASLAMMVNIALVALAAYFLLKWPLGASILLGAILAPTDPVLASDVQVEDIADRDRLRFSLTGEAGMNDGTAFPFVMLGLGLLGHHELGAWGWRWLAFDVVWATVAGLGIGAVLGIAIGKFVLHLRRNHREAVGLDDFLALGLIALSYGVALLAYGYGFLAVFAAGLAFRATERHATPDHIEASELAATHLTELAARTNSSEKEASYMEEYTLTSPRQTKADKSGEEVDAEMIAATNPATAPAYMAQHVLAFNEQIERIGQIVVVLLLGAMILSQDVPPQIWWLAPLLFLVMRPLAVQIGLIGARVSRSQRRLIGWFGIRGIGSVYYLMYAVEHGLEKTIAKPMTALVFAIIAISIVVHGVSVTPLMNRYAERFHKA